MAEKTVAFLAELSSKGLVFKNDHDALAFTIHMQFLRNEFVCTGISEEDSEKKDLSEIPEGWNDSDEGYCFCYRSKDGKEKVLLKMMKIEDSLLVYAMKPKQNAKLHKVHLVLKDRIKQSPKGEKPVLDKKLFVDLIALIKDFEFKILNPILGVEPKKPDESSNSEETKQTANTRQEPIPIDPGAPRPGFPGFEPTAPRFPGRLQPRPRPRPGFNPFGPDTGMLIGPRNPGFGRGGVPDPRRPFPGRNPGRIPGARFDPFGPFGAGGPGEPKPDHWRAPGRGFDDEDII
mmetsp:Transcript_5770/g.14009  ORF Transcript_5770/g.14009 Transcript_5770/m.14009 type:complete len:289 (-) Transcript_5770:56-922(-)|eukprot:CAMPEP_0114497284 /NCGR_PEP_ID=MMETSP0109-20121206/6240_1 /TAXON_ID=29199 /ORGANISM="Chlorarachnion reptans, Strain CCCM449" /LENGTH=288 /DNA_ID=CAMNT_0001674651 /DNA_START=140 /DNA_END=1006 /DNA_ORIENTATION=+